MCDFSKIYNEIFKFYDWIDIYAMIFNDEFKKRYTKIPFAVYHAEHITKAGGYETLLHQHKEIELITVTQGHICFYIGEEHFALKSGDTIIIPPYVPHRSTIDDTVPPSYLCLCFDLRIIYDEELRCGLENNTLFIRPYIQNGETGAEEYARCVTKAFLAYQEQYEGWELASIGYMSIFFAQLKKNGDVVRDERQKTGRDFCLRTMNYISAHYREAITSCDVAKVLFMNESYFCRLFRKNFGITFSNYMLSYRIEKAKNVLEYTEFPISEIAASVGFSDFSYFSKVFKELCGVSPSRYRKIHTSFKREK